MVAIKRLASTTQNNKSVEDFTGDTPDTLKPADPVAATLATKPRVMKGNQAQITLTIPVSLLNRASATAERLSISRAAFMKLAISRAVEAERA